MRSKNMACSSYKYTLTPLLPPGRRPELSTPAEPGCVWGRGAAATWPRAVCAATPPAPVARGDRIERNELDSEKYQWVRWGGV